MLQIRPHSSDTCFSHAEQCLLIILCSLEHPSVGEVTVFFRRMVDSQQYAPKKQKCFQLRFVNYAVQVDIHMKWICTQGRKGHVWLKMTPTPVTVWNLTGKVEGHEHQLGGTQLNCNQRVIVYFVSTLPPPASQTSFGMVLWNALWPISPPSLVNCLQLFFHCVWH
jgi:hypothetical protein